MFKAASHGVAALALVLCGLSPAIAGGYTVHPVSVALSPERQATTLRVTNTNSQPVTIQVELQHWSQPEGEDQLAPTSDVIAMPPMFTVAPGQHQVVRVGLRKPLAADKEQAYRLLLKEIPGQSSGGGLQLALNMSLPVFVKPSVSVTPQVDWQVERLEDGKLALSVDNHGAGHFRFTEWQIIRRGEAVAANTKLQYLLPGTSKRWTLTPQAAMAAGDEVDIVVVSAGRKLRTRTTVESVE